MEKKLILAIALSMGVLLLWSQVVQKLYHVENKGVTVTSTVEKPGNPSSLSSPAIGSPSPATSPSSVPVQQKNEILTTVKKDNADIIFEDTTGSIKKIVFNQYGRHPFYLERGFEFAIADFDFKKEIFDSNRIVFSHKDSEKIVKKEFIYSNSNYNMELDVSVTNITNKRLTVFLPLNLVLANLKINPVDARFINVSVGLEDKTLYPSPKVDKTFNGVKYVAFLDRYYCAIVGSSNREDNCTAFIRKVDASDFYVSMNVPELTVDPGATVIKKFNIYLGPQQVPLISKVNPEWATIIHYGPFNFISHILLQILEFLHSVFHNWGVAIIVMSVLIYILFYPLSVKQMRSMKHMQDLQPRIEELRKQYKDNPQKFQKEMMELYRINKVNPFGGCLPMLLQLPVFLALYQALMRSIVLNGAHFLWIKDLSQPDRLMVFSSSVPLIGNELNILPILMAIGMFFQQKTTMTAQGTATTSQDQQKMMLIIFPIMFGFIFYKMPAGLVLYWFTNSLLMFMYQLKVLRQKSPERTR